MKKIYSVLLVVLVGMTFIPCQAFGLEKVLVVFPTGKAVAHSPFFVAQKMGYFEQEGLTMEFTTIPGGLEPLKAVATGKGQLAFPAPTSLIVARDGGLPVRSVFALRQQWIFGFTAMKNSNITKMADLKGKTIGVISESAGFIAKLMIAGSNDVRLQDVNIQVVGANMAGPLAAGKVDAIYSWDTLYAAYKRRGLDVVWISGPEYEKFQSNILATSEQLIKEKPKMLEGYLRGLTKGIVFGIENPEAALKIIAESEPQLTKDFEKGLEELRIGNSDFQSKLQAQYGYGYNSLQSWELQATILYEKLHEISRVLPGDQYFDNGFIKAANSFNKEEIRKQARAYGK